MAITKSSRLQDALSTETQVFTASGLNIGSMYSSVDSISINTATAVADDVFGLCLIPSYGRIREIYVRNADLDTNGSPTLTYNLGLYYLEGDLADTTPDDNFYVSAATGLQAADVVGRDVMFNGRGAAGLNQLGQRVFEDAGLTEDNSGYFYLGIEIVTAAATGATGLVAIDVRYTK